MTGAPLRRSVAAAAAVLGAVLPAGAGAAPEAPAFSAVLQVHELGFDGGFRLRLYEEPGYIPIPAGAGHLFLVAADSAEGRNAFFIPTDLAFEVGANQIYQVEFEQASDLFGQALGGKLRPGETQLGFILVPAAVRLDRYLPGRPDSVVIRYAHRRAAFSPAGPGERAEWEASVPRKLLAAGLNAWWEWERAMNGAPAMSDGEKAFLVGRLFGGDRSLLAGEGMSAEALRNAILRVGDRKLLEGPARQRVSPAYPEAARQAGVSGLVVALCYVNESGEVADAGVLASNTAHILNLSALVAAMDWRFPPANGPDGRPTDGWRLLPFQFELKSGRTAADSLAAASGDSTAYTPPRIVRKAEAEYPDKAYHHRIAGTVVYRATIGADGKLTQAELVKGVHPLLDQAALTALEHCLFLPASRNGVSVQGTIEVPYTFGGDGR